MLGDQAPSVNNGGSAPRSLFLHNVFASSVEADRPCFHWDHRTEAYSNCDLTRAWYAGEKCQRSQWNSLLLSRFEFLIKIYHHSWKERPSGSHTTCVAMFQLIAIVANYLYVVRFQMFYVGTDDLFKYLWYSAGEKNWFVIWGIPIAPFLYTATKFACFQSFGTTPLCKKHWKIVQRI